jgi:DNA polymerase-1
MRAPRLLLTAQQVEAAVAHLSQFDRFVIDIETTSVDPRTNSLLWVGLGGPNCVYLIPCGHPKGNVLVPEHKEKTAAFIHYGPDDKRSYTGTGKASMRMIEHTVPAIYASPPEQLYPHQVCELIRPLLFSDRFKLGHNVKFDLQSLAKYYDGVIPPPPYDDTIIVRHVLSEELQEYGLKWLTCEWFGVPKAQRNEFYPALGKHGIEQYGLDEVARYLAKDVRYCWLMFNRFFPLLESRDLLGVYAFEMSVYPVIMRMEQRGFRVDLSKMDTVRKDLERRIHEVEQQCYIMAGDEFSLSNTDAKRWVLFGEDIPEFGKSKRKLHSQNLRVLRRTPKEQKPAVTADVLEWYADRGNKMAEFLGEWAELEKVRGTFIEGLSSFLRPHKNDLPTIHTSYKQHGTVTGRLSSATPNLQQLPRGSTIRDLFVAGAGNLLIVADYDQIELRCAGYLSQDPEMIAVFKRGEDIHRSAAAAMFRLDPADVTSELRQVGKTQNFAVLYGAGPDKIAAVAGCSKTRAEELIKGYFQTFPALEEWKYKELQRARKRGDRANPLHDPPRVVIPPNGRLRRLPDLFELQEDWIRYRAERQAINAIVQGFAANITKLAMLSLEDSLPDDSAMLAQVHDEIVVLAPEGRTAVVLPIVVRTMGDIVHPETGEPILGEIPLVASAATGTSWAAAKAAA